MSKTKGEYHYAIQALESRLAKIKKKPAKFAKSNDRIASIQAALECLRINNLLQVGVRVLEPKPLEELYADADADKREALGLPA